MTPAAVPLDLVTPGVVTPRVVTLAHEAVGPSQLWQDWHPDPLVVAGLAVLAVAYRQGLSFWRRPARRRVGSAARQPDRPPGARARRPPIGTRQVAAFAGGLLTLAVALASPLDGAAATLFSAHMVQHLLLIVVAAPLLVGGRTGLVVTRTLPRRGRRLLQRTRTRSPVRWAIYVVSHPAVVWASGTVVLWVWHLPSPYQAAVRHDAVHALEHLTLVATAGLLWTVVLQAARRRLPVPVAVLLLFATGLQGAALGAVLVFARTPLYPIHEPAAPLWDLTPLEDQQLAGGLMWVPPGLVYLGVIASLVVRWFDALETRDAGPPDDAVASGGRRTREEAGALDTGGQLAVGPLVEETT
jgi:putative membrane protein